MIKPQVTHCLMVVSIIALCVVNTLSQTATQYDKGTPPQHAAGISALGSYASAELGTVNLSNGSLNLKIPLGTVGGRGFSIPLTLNYSSKVWSASMDTDTDWTGLEHPVAYADYDRGADWSGWGNFIGAGWSIGAVPILISRRVQIQKITGGSCNGGYAYLLTKFTLKMPDGGEVEFRDDLYDGAPQPASGCGSSAPTRGVRWHATDGSGTIFIKDVAEPDGLTFYDTSGVVITRDGTRYRFNGPWCASITDRNGNKITIQLLSGPEARYTDQLGRVTSIKQNAVDPDNPSIALAVLVTFPGYQGQPRYFKIKSGVMNQNYRPDIAPTVPVITGDWDPQSKGFAWPAGTTRLFNQSYGMYAYEIDDLDVLSQVVLPDARSINFRYNMFGEVAEVTLPTGGKIQYDYAYNSALPSGNSPVFQTGTDGSGGAIRTDVKQVDRAVVASRTYPDGSTLEGKRSYSYGLQSVNAVNYAFTEVQARSDTDALLMDQRHFFLTASQYTEPPNGMGNHDGTHYALWSTGIEWRTETRDAAGVVMNATEQDWTQRAPVSWSIYPQEQPAKDNRVNQSRRYLENSMMAKTETTYDQYNNPTEVREYDFDQTLKRRTTTTYLTLNNGWNYATDDSIHLPSLPVTTTVCNAAGTQVAQIVNEYDIYTSDVNHAPLTDYGSVSQHDSNYGIAKTARGNVTAVGQWLNTINSLIYSYSQLDTLGNVISTKDANGNVTSLSFADDFGLGQNPGSPSQNPASPTYAMPTLITSPPPTPGAPVHTARSQFDYSTGLLTGFRDRNNIVTQTIYSDPFNRPTLVKAALGVTGVETHTANYYAPATMFGITLAKNDVLRASDLNTLDDASLRSWTVTDGFGRTTEAWTRDPQGDVKVSTNYDGLGRAKQTTNPFRPATESGFYTTTAYDLAGRVTSVTTSDNAAVTTSYVGNSVTVTDQAGKARKSVTDALGRLIEVYEDPSGVNFQTSYLYDTLDNLVRVTQGSQQRFFMYDSLKRLIRSRNPEQSTLASLDLSDTITGNNSWSVGYQYDGNGNLTQKTDARGTQATYGYDALNRNTSVDYSDSTPDVFRQYDLAINGIGRLNQEGQGGSTGSATYIDSYDALGRARIQGQRFETGGVWSDSYPIQRTYNLAGQVSVETYPSGHTVTYSYDSAGRTNGFSGNLGDGATRSYASSFNYNARSQITQELFGTQTPLYHKLQYNIRGQLWDVRVSTGSDVNGSWNRGCLQFFYDGSYGYGTSGPDNNGNVLFSNTYDPLDDQSSSWAIHRQSYSYDSLNRLASTTENFVTDTQAESQQSLQSYSYDRWGNRTINPSSWGVGINTKQFTVDTATNRLGVPVGQSGVMNYDSAGNLITDTYTGVGSRTYDAENRMITAADNTGQTSRYSYNATGQRVRRQVAAGWEEWQVYGMDGELLAEYPASGPVTGPHKEYGYRNGQLLVSTDVSGSVSWTSLVGVTVSGNSLSKSAADGWDAGAVSTQTITSGDGYVEVTATETNKYRRFGLSNGDSNQSWEDIDFCIYLEASGTLYINEGTTQRGSFGSYASGDVLRVAVEGGVVKYRKNGALLYTSTLSPTYPLLVDTSLYSTGATLTNVKLVHANNVGWTSAVGVTVSGNSLSKAAADGWDAGAVSTQTITSGNGYVEVTATETNKYRRFGLSNGNSNQSWEDIDFCIYLEASGTLYINEGTTQRGSFGTYASGDVLRVAVEGGVVTYRKNGALLYTSTLSPTYPLLVDTSLYSTGATLTNVVMYTGAPAATIEWLVTDHLGTPRIILDETGSLAGVKHHDYLPFGEELFAGAGGRTTTQGYTGTDGVRQQFTAKERDNETNLDYFGARYYASTQGRFTSPDPLLSSARSLQPQSWNRYSYVLNRPLSLVDLNGLDWGYADWTDDQGVNHRDYHYFTGDIGNWGGHSYTAVNFGGDATRTLDLSDGRTVAISNNPDALNGAYMRDVTAHPQAEQAPVLPPSWVDYVPVVGTARQFLFDYTTHNFEGALLGFGKMSFELGSVAAGGAVAASSDATAVATEEASTTLYRAVGQAEYEQIMETGTFEAGPNSLGGKWFAETAEHANQWGEVLEGKGAFKVVDAKIPTVQANQFMRLERLDGIGPARYAELNELKGAVIGKGP